MTRIQKLRRAIGAALLAGFMLYTCTTAIPLPRSSAAYQGF
jgi:hypothetical protein